MEAECSRSPGLLIIIFLIILNKIPIKIRHPSKHSNTKHEGKKRQHTIGRDQDNIKDKHKYGQTQTRQKYPHITNHANTQHEGMEGQDR